MSDSAMSDLGFSLLTSILTVVIFWLTKLTWDKWLEDFWLKRACRNVVDISGTWKFSETDDDGTVVEVIELKQFGWKVKGKASYELTSNTKNKRDEFELIGIFRSDILALYYSNVDNTRRGAGTICLELQSDADVFQGHSVIYDTNNSVLKCVETKYERQR
jgi:hypothetical protein